LFIYFSNNTYYLPIIFTGKGHPGKGSCNLDTLLYEIIHSKNTKRKCFDLQLIMDINQKGFIHDISCKVSSAKRGFYILYFLYLIRSTRGLTNWLKTNIERGCVNFRINLLDQLYCRLTKKKNINNLYVVLYCKPMTCSFYTLTILNIEKCVDLQLNMDINQKEFIHDISCKVSSAKRDFYILYFFIFN